jgi:hypothetical protein
MEFSELLGKTLTKIEGKKGGEEIVFFTSDGQVYRLWHEEDCSESVAVEDICGDLNDLIGSPITRASEDCNEQDVNPPGLEADPLPGDTFTWTFYNIATAKGHVTIRWYGSSNGFYSEKVSFCLVE